MHQGLLLSDPCALECDHASASWPLPGRRCCYVWRVACQMCLEALGLCKPVSQIRVCGSEMSTQSLNKINCSPADTMHDCTLRWSSAHGCPNVNTQVCIFMFGSSIAFPRGSDCFVSHFRGYFYLLQHSQQWFSLISGNIWFHSHHHKCSDFFKYCRIVMLHDLVYFRIFQLFLPSGLSCSCAALTPAENCRFGVLSTEASNLLLFLLQSQQDNIWNPQNIQSLEAPLIHQVCSRRRGVCW